MKKRLLFLAVLLAVFFVFAYTAAFAGTKVVICHHNLDDPDEPEWITIEVSESAVPAHLAHGDILGACVVEPPPAPVM